VAELGTNKAENLKRALRKKMSSEIVIAKVPNHYRASRAASFAEHNWDVIRIGILCAPCAPPWSHGFIIEESGLKPGGSKS
jgi:hypothetical protein